MASFNLKISGIEIPFDSSQEIRNSYSPIESSSIIRMSDGAGIKQVAWSGKYKIEVSGTGRIPLPIDGLNFNVSHDLECIEPLTKYSTGNIFALPTARRLDISSLGFAVVNGRAIKTPLAISGDIATLDVVADATGYHVIYYPKFTVFIQPPKKDSAPRSLATFGWSFVAEEM